MRLKFGVYKTETFIPHLEKKFPSITNFGIKPTISGDLTPLFETHILNFTENLYGKKIFVEFIDFMRDEKKFSSIEELKKQILIDVSASC
jgi:riboflavin kinase/FMN adenylyltransferase